MFRSGAETSVFEAIGNTCGQTTDTVVRKASSDNEVVVQNHTLELNVHIETGRYGIACLDTCVNCERLVFFPGHTTDTGKWNDIEFPVGVIFAEKVD